MPWTLLPGYDWLVLLQTTSPLRTVGRYRRRLERCRGSGGRCLRSVTPAEQSPYWMYTLGEDGTMQPLLHLVRRIVRGGRTCRRSTC